MKKLIKVTMAVAALLVMFACSDKIETPKYLDVTPNNISGSWRLESSCGAPLAEGAYVYVDFDRKDRTFEMYQNTDSFSTRYITGRYYIYVDGNAGSVIRGDYDFGNGAWAHRYIVTNLTENRMVWTALDDSKYVDVYVRCDIPAAILTAGADEE